MSAKSITLRMREAFDTRIAALAGRQRGYVTRAQLLALGVSRHQITYAIRARRLIPVYSGVYAVGHLPTLPQARAFGALLACGKGVVLSHGTAATVWGIFTRWELPFEVTAAAPHDRAGIRVHRAALTHADMTRQLGLPVTSAARTVLDVTPRLTDKALTRAVNELRRVSHLRLHELEDLLARVPRHPGRKRLLPFIERPSGPTRSEFEDAFLAFCERFGLPRPLVNTIVGGVEVDAFFPEHRLIVELDSWGFHSSRESFRSDRERDAEMLALGFRTVRITWERLIEAPEREAERLRAILARAA